MTQSEYEGRQDHIRDWQTPEIETFENIYADKDYEIRMTIPEFTCVCPKTGLPDFAVIHLTYVPGARCVELKSLKEYTLAYRNKGIFHENVVNKMLDDIVEAIHPRRFRIEGVFNPRGGIQTTVVREYEGE
jgi:7-cyano-7-deazaguanine reductase